MKSQLTAVILTACMLLSGCASADRRIVLDPVGPLPSRPATGSGNGSLLVFSAFSVEMPSNKRPDHLHHTDYKIFTQDGRLFQAVHNDYDNSWEGPRKVELPSGSYRVRARADCYGVVTVPVVIEPHEVTEVHLEGRAVWPRESARLRNNLVRLPGGEIVGWRAAESATVTVTP